jgi:hypothetical protein
MEYILVGGGKRGGKIVRCQQRQYMLSNIQQQQQQNPTDGLHHGILIALYFYSFLLFCVFSYMLYSRIGQGHLPSTMALIMCC